MYSTESNGTASCSRPDLRRWDRWLRESLAPAMVALTDIRNLDENELRWTVDLPHGVRSVIRIPRTLVEASSEDFHRTTIGLGSFPWQSALEHAGAAGLRLVCPDNARAPAPTGS